MFDPQQSLNVAVTVLFEQIAQEPLAIELREKVVELLLEDSACSWDDIEGAAQMLLSLDPENPLGQRALAEVCLKDTECEDFWASDADLEGGQELLERAITEAQKRYGNSHEKLFEYFYLAQEIAMDRELPELAVQYLKEAALRLRSGDSRFAEINKEIAELEQVLATSKD